jgi:hypothetical protein
MIRELILGNRNPAPEVTSAQNPHDLNGLPMRTKNLCRTTKFVDLIGCQIDFFQNAKKIVSALTANQINKFRWPTQNSDAH